MDRRYCEGARADDEALKGRTPTLRSPSSLVQSFITWPDGAYVVELQDLNMFSMCSLGCKKPDSLFVSHWPLQCETKCLVRYVCNSFRAVGPHAETRTHTHQTNLLVHCCWHASRLQNTASSFSPGRRLSTYGGDRKLVRRPLGY